MSRSSRHKRYLKENVTCRFSRQETDTRDIVTLTLVNKGDKQTTVYRKRGSRWYWLNERLVPVTVKKTVQRIAPIDHPHTRDGNRLGRGASGQSGRHYRLQTEREVLNLDGTVVCRVEKQELSMSHDEFDGYLRQFGKYL